MKTYLVQWEIEIDADSPQQAARLAREIQLDPKNVADHFTVWDTTKDEWADPTDVDVMGCLYP